MTISVLICTKNRPGDFMITVQSLLDQSRHPDELIVIDASDDQSLQGSLDPHKYPFRVVYLHSAPGLTRQRNLGIQESAGDLLFFFDDDVVLERDYISRVEQVFREDARMQIGAVGGRVTNSLPSGHETWLSRLNRWTFASIRWIFMLSRLGSGNFQFSGMPTHPHLRTTSKTIQCLSGCCMAFRRQVFASARFDENLAGYGQMEDADVSKQVLEAGYQIYYAASAMLEHHVSPQDRLKFGQMAEMTIVNYAHFFQKHWPQTWLRRAAFNWTLCGLFLLYGRKAVGRQGVLRGMKRAAQDDRTRRANHGDQS